MRPSSSRAGRQAGWRENPRPRPASWLAPLPAPGLGKEKRERRAVMSPCSLARRASGASAPTSGLRPAPAHPAGVIGPHPYPSPSGLAGGFVARRQPPHTQGSRGAGCGGQHPPGRGGRERTPLPLTTHRTGRVPEGKPGGGPPCPPPKIKTPSRGGLGLAVELSHRQTAVAQSLCYRPVKIFRIPRRAHPVPPVQVAPPVRPVLPLQLRHPLLFELSGVLVPE